MDSIIILTSYLGFVLAGGYLFPLKQRKVPWLFILYSAFVLLPVSIGLPLEIKTRIAAWVAGVLLAGLYARRPVWLPGWLQNPKVLSACFAVVSLLVFLLSLFRMGWLYLSIPAFLAGVFNLIRVFQKSDDGRGAVKNLKGTSA
ncbi:MAG: hypothetical protein IT308_08615 [Anaerolineaceae bacterium]|nr:hypothetical protein [Anaerolineaceae bacterium]